MFTLRLSLFSTGVATLLASSAFGQWNSNNTANLAIGDLGNDQVQAKIKPTSDGGCYVSWFDNATGGYDVRLQRLTAQGVEQWAHNGVLVADLTLSSTQDYGLAVDASDNAILTFQDTRFGGTKITAAKITPAGTLDWGVNGIQVSTASGNNPKVAVTNDGSYVVGWSEGTGTRFQRLDSTGAAQWVAGGVNFTPATGSYSVSDIQPGDNGSAIVLWVRPIGNFLSNRHLYTQKLDTTGAAIWNSGNPVIIYDSSSVQNGYFPTFLADGAGGGVYGWYENGGVRNGYVQHVNAAGAEVFAHNGVVVSTVTGTQGRLDGSVAYNPVTNDIFFFWVEVSLPNQNSWGVFGQKVDSAGARQWGAGGKALVPLAGMQPSFVRAVATTDGGAMSFWFNNATSGKVVGARLDAAGNYVWGRSGFVDACATVSGKSRLAMAISGCGDALLAWGDARSDGGNIYAQNVNPDGSFGNETDPGDINGDTVVNIDDLLAVVNAWGACSGCAADIEPVDCPNGVVNIDDLLTIINNWG